MLGRVLNETTAAGSAEAKSYNYWHDANGNVTTVYYDRADIDGVIRHTNIDFIFDSENRETEHFTQYVDSNAPTVNHQDIAYETRYDAYGETIAQRTNGGNDVGAWQQFSQYDNAGRVTLTNSDGGVAKAYFYDGVGNATLAIDSQTIDLRTLSLADLATRPTDLNRTITVYDKRGQVVDVIQPRIDSSRSTYDTAITLVGVQSGDFNGVIMSIGGTQATSGAQGGGSAPSSPGNESVTGWMVSNASASWGIGGDGQLYFNGVGVNLPAFSQFYGDYTARVVVSWSITGEQYTPFYNSDGGYSYYMSDYSTGGTTQQVVTGTPGGVWLPVGWASGPMGESLSVPSSYQLSYTAQVFLTPTMGGPEVAVGTISSSGNQMVNPEYQTGFNDGGPYQYVVGFDATNNESSRGYGWGPAGNQLVFGRDLGNASSVYAYYRLSNSGQPFTPLGLGNINGVGGTYYADLNALPPNWYDVVFVATDFNGNVIRRNYAQVNNTTQQYVPWDNVPWVNSSSANLNPFQAASADNTGTYVITNNEVDIFNLHAANGTKADIAYIRYRPLGSTAAYQAVPIGDWGSISHFTWDTTGLNGAYDVQIWLHDRYWQLLDKVEGTMVFGANARVDPMTYIQNLPSTVLFQGLSTAGVRLEMDIASVAVAGSNPGPSGHITLGASGGGVYYWDADGSGYVPDKSLTYTYHVYFKAYDSDGFQVDGGEGYVAFGPNPSTWLVADSKPRVVTFNPQIAGASSIALHFRVAGSAATTDYSSVQINRLSSGLFKLSTASVGIADSTMYEYDYDVFDAGGNLLARDQRQ